MGRAAPGARIGATIREIRERKLMTRSDLAELSGASVQGITRVELGESDRPRRKTIERIAAALGMDPDELVGEARQWQDANEALAAWMNETERRLSGDPSHQDVWYMVSGALAFGPGRADHLPPEERERFAALRDRLAEEGASRIAFAHQLRQMQEEGEAHPSAT